MSLKTYTANTEEEMLALGEEIGRRLPRKTVVFLQGNLGAGKTTLTKGIVKGLGAAEPEDVSSPTFSLIHEYGNPVTVYHIDLYRLDEPKQLAGLGLEEIFDREAVVIIEWPDRFLRWLPESAIQIAIRSVNEGRTITVKTPLTD